jgi:hypothetical protein
MGLANSLISLPLFGPSLTQAWGLYMSSENVERSIGRLEGKLDGLLFAVEKNQEKSEQGRSRIYLELEQIRAEASESKVKSEAMKSRLDEAGPIISDIKKWRERFIGMQMMVIAISAALGIFAQSIIGWIKTKLGFS